SLTYHSEDVVPAAQANVATNRPSRHLTQLCKHFGQKIHAEHDNEKGTTTFDAGTCVQHARDRVPRLRAEAVNDDGLRQVQDVVGSHLERFGAQDELTVQCTRVAT